MATLNGTQINNTYPGLIKTTDNNVIGAVEKEITDGVGNASTLKLGTISASFVGTLDLSAAVVTGIPAAGLIAGTGTDSMESDPDLTTLPASAEGVNSIALGDNAVAFSDGSISIGTSVNDADNSRFKAVTIGNNLGTAQRTVNIGNSQDAYGADGVCIGGSNSFGGDFNVAVGYTNTISGSYNNQIAIGANSSAAATGAVALGSSVTATTTDTVSVKALETQTPSTPTAGGVIMIDAGSIARRLNIDASGGLQIDSTPVGGGGGSAGLIAGTGTGAMRSANFLNAIASVASGLNDIAIGGGATALAVDSISIGLNANNQLNGSGEGVAIGKSATTGHEKAVAIGHNASAWYRGISIGYNTNNGTKGGCIAIGQQATTASSTGDNAIAIGSSASATAGGAIALGQVTAATLNTVTLRKLQISDYATLGYADDTAAAAGGIPLGGVYHTSGALKIRIV